jgi:hypothetical protein
MLESEEEAAAGTLFFLAQPLKAAFLPLAWHGVSVPGGPSAALARL